MVLFAPVAAAISTGAGAGATALGLNLDKQSVELTRECFLLQMRQAKRLFTAQWAEAAYHHGEASLNSTIVETGTSFIPPAKRINLD